MSDMSPVVSFTDDSTVDDYIVIVWERFTGRWSIVGTYSTLAAARGQKTRLRHRSPKIVRMTGWEVIE